MESTLGLVTPVTDEDVIQAFMLALGEAEQTRHYTEQRSWRVNDSTVYTTPTPGIPGPSKPIRRIVLSAHDRRYKETAVASLSIADAPDGGRAIEATYFHDTPWAFVATVNRALGL
jgi:hypothetical protein